MKRLGIELQTVFGMPPVEHILLAAELGCGHISTALGPVPWKLECFPSWSLREDHALRKKTIAVLNDTGVKFSLAEGFAIRPDSEVKDYANDLDIMAELGAVAVSTVCLDPDQNRCIDQLAILAQLVADRSMKLNLEFAPPHSINTLNKALGVIHQLGSDQIKLLIDSMHFFRSGETLSSLAEIDPHLIGYVQLSDVADIPPCDDYYREACFDRRLPGEGSLPLQEFIKMIPQSLIIGLEVPIFSRLSDASDVRKLAEEAVKGAKRILL